MKKSIEQLKEKEEELIHEINEVRGMLSMVDDEIYAIQLRITKFYKSATPKNKSSTPKTLEPDLTSEYQVIL